MENQSIKVGITIGDINGISPEIIIKSLSDKRVLEGFTPVIYGLNEVFDYYKELLNNEDFVFQQIPSADEIINKKINLINLQKESVQIDLGLPTKIAGEVAIESLKRATSDLAAGKIDVLVTAPFCKESVQMSGFEFPGHTEFLANLSGENDALMVLMSPSLKVALVTVHIPIKEVVEVLTKDLIERKIQEFNNCLIKDFGIVKPKIAILGLNPHAGENGKIGREEKEIILPAINSQKKQGVLAFGPYPSDGFFGSKMLSSFDGVLAMYHDQGLGPFKALCFDDGVNYTAGLPIVRTSPDHGTAFDIAGKNKASAQSMRSAIYCALDVFKCRKWVREISKNPLKSMTDKNQKKEKSA